VNILYLCHRIPFPPDKGDKIRSYHQIESLGARHRVHVATFVDSAEDERHVPELRERCASLVVDRRTTTTNLTRAAAALPRTVGVTTTRPTSIMRSQVAGTASTDRGRRRLTAASE
jgi:hypothetical protein